MEAKQIIGAVIGTVVKVVIIAIVLMFVYRYSIEAYDYGYRIFGEEAVDEEPGRDVIITIMPDDTTGDIGDMLEKKGLIRDAKLFVIQEKLSGLDKDIAEGTYELNTAMNIEEMLEIMTAGGEEKDAED